MIPKSWLKPSSAIEGEDSPNINMSASAVKAQKEQMFSGLCLKADARRL
jgi:hypothetical protein